MYHAILLAGCIRYKSINIRAFEFTGTSSNEQKTAHSYVQAY